MSVPLSEARPGASEADLEALEKQVGRPLSEDYANWLRQHDGGIPSPNEFDVDGEALGSVDEYFGAREVIRHAQVFGSKRLGPSTWPVAYSACGNLVCLRHDEHRWQVVFWDHETEGVTPIAICFSDFLDDVEELDLEAIRPDSDQVIDAWVDPALLEELGQKQ